MKTIAILTSGGDAPGMNAAINSIVRISFFHKLKVFGILCGFEGLIDGNFIKLDPTKVSNIIQRGGTILKSSRSDRFLKQSIRKLAYEKLKSKNIEGLIVLGGDGTFRGAIDFSREFNFPIIGVPCTIDNDINGTDFCIGYDTAINTAMDAIDKIRDTAESHNRLFFVEVMGRDSGLIALRTGISTGAEVILVPETKMTISQIISVLKKRKKNKSSLIVVVAEGDEEGGAFTIAQKINKLFPEFNIRVTTLGHIQRGGKPTCMDRFLAIRMGHLAVEGLLSGKRNSMIGIQNENLKFIDFEKAVKNDRKLDKTFLQLMHVLNDQNS